MALTIAAADNAKRDAAERERRRRALEKEKQTSEDRGRALRDKQRELREGREAEDAEDAARIAEAEYAAALRSTGKPVPVEKGWMHGFAASMGHSVVHHPDHDELLFSADNTTGKMHNANLAPSE